MTSLSARGVWRCSLVVFLHQQQQPRQHCRPAWYIGVLGTAAADHSQLQKHFSTLTSSQINDFRHHDTITTMKCAVILAVVLLATFVPESRLQQAGKPRSWMPQGRFGKRQMMQADETMMGNPALRNSKYTAFYTSIHSVIEIS